MSKQDIGYLVKSINEKLKAKADADAKEHQLTLSQSFVLTFLDSKGGQATQKEIEEHLDVSHPAVVGIVSRMEQHHHVTSWIDPNNKRIKMVRLTPQAQALVEEMGAMCSRWEKDMLEGFSPEDTARLRELLSRVNDNMVKMQSR